MTGKLICVPPVDLPNIWPAVSDMIDAAYAELDEVTPDVFGWLTEKKGLLWVYASGDKIFAACTTAIVTRRTGKALRIVAIGGGAMDLWKDSQMDLERYARDEGCVKMIADGRIGWGRTLAGYKVKALSLEKVL